MSGLLRRLAGQALGGNKPVIHSMARMPYVAPPVLVQDTEVSLLETGHASPAPDTPRGVSHAVLHSSTQEVSNRIQVSTPGKADALVSSVIGQAPAAAQLCNRVSVSDGMKAETDAPEAAVQGPTAMTDTTRVEFAARQVSATSHSGLQQPRTVLTSAPLPAEIMPNFMDKGALSTPQIPVEASPSDRPDPLTFSLPAPLVHRVEAPPSRPPVGPSRSDAGPSPPHRAHEPETTEVHVHIGRIEVTAVHEAPTQKARAAPARKSMSLEEYLARRKGGQT